MAVRIEIAYRDDAVDPRGSSLRSTIRDFLGVEVQRVRTCDSYSIVWPLSQDQIVRVQDVLRDPVVQVAHDQPWCPAGFDYAITVGFKAGVTDAVGRSAATLLDDLLDNKTRREALVFTSRTYFLWGVTLEQAKRVTIELLCNPVIEDYSIFAASDYPPPAFALPLVRSDHKPQVQPVELPPDDQGLMAVSNERFLALSLDEMRVIQRAFQNDELQQTRLRLGLPNSPTDVEIECLAQTWSEHCKHKIFNATIDYHEVGTEPEIIRSLFKTFIREPTERIMGRHIAASGSSWLVSVFHDNAGVIRFNDRFHLVYKVETHNSPSALDPYGGAMTGIVGVNRDPFGTGLGADLLCNVWGYCFADPRWKAPVPRGLLHPRRVRDGVHRGVVDGGNQSGVPYARGWELFDDRYLGKPLVYCGTVARMPVESAGRPGHVKSVLPGDRIVMCGGRIGKDGIHGATFSSLELDESSPVQAVQIGDPITQKRMFDFLLVARDRGLYRAITDNGAGGLSSSIGELCILSGGALLELHKAPLKYAGLDPWEILVSEAQERMSLAVDPSHLDDLTSLAAEYEVDLCDLGQFTSSGAFHLLYSGQTVGYIPLELLHDGLPPMMLHARWEPPTGPHFSTIGKLDSERVLLDLLRRPNLASNEDRARNYDHEVKGLSVVKPLVGEGRDVPSDAAVMLVEHGCLQGVVLGEGVHPAYADIDAYWATAAAIDEAFRRVVGTGARIDHIAGLDNYCWPDPIVSSKNPDGHHKLAQLVRSAKALAHFCEAYGVPCISGKDSMKNDTVLDGQRISIPPTLLFSTIGIIDDVTNAVTLDPKRVGSLVYALGITRHELAGSELLQHLSLPMGTDVPRVDPNETLPLYSCVAEAIRDGLLLSSHVVGRGGFAIAAARMCLAGRMGLDLNLDLAPGASQLTTDVAMFSESTGRYLVTVALENKDRFERLFQSCAAARLGVVSHEPTLCIRWGNNMVLRCDLDTMLRAWKETLHAH